MKRFAIALNAGIGAVNSLLAICGTQLAARLAFEFERAGHELPKATLLALKLPPAAWLLAIAGFAAAAAGKWKQTEDGKLVYAAIWLMAADIALLTFCAFAFAFPQIKMVPYP